MQQITSLFARKVINAVDGQVDKHAALASIGLDLDEHADPLKMIAADDYYGLLEHLAEVDRNGISMPLRVGKSMCCDDYGAFGLAWKTAVNLRGSYQRAERYGRVLTSVTTHELERTEAAAYLNIYRTPANRPGMCLSNEMTIASICAISREVSALTFAPLGVYFKHAAPSSLEHHEAYFECPVYFNAERDALLVSDDHLEATNQLGDEGVSKFFDRHLSAQLAEFSDEEAGGSLVRRVSDQISRSLSEGTPLISEVARHFGVSARTLQRKLAEHRCSFQDLVDDSRRQLAQRLLQETDFSLAEIAFMTGFSEQSAFNRAFKRWQGQSPRAFRIESHPTSR